MHSVVVRAQYLAHYKWNFVVIYSLSVIYIDWSMFFQHSATHTTVSTGALLRTLRIINGTFVVIFYVSAVIHLTEELTHDQHYRCISIY